MTLKAGTRFALLVYDIPSTSKLRNPSNLLRRFGARINLSCWVLPTRNLALLPVKDWIEKGAVVEVVEFEEHESEKVVALARRAILKDVDDMRAHVEKSVASVRRRFAAIDKLASGTGEREKAFAAASHFAYVSLYRAKNIADAAEEAALHFDLTSDVKSLADALRSSIKAKSALFFEIAKVAKEKVSPSFLEGAV